jgi:hypothetical protein
MNSDNEIVLDIDFMGDASRQTMWQSKRRQKALVDRSQKSKALRKLEEIGLTRLETTPGRDTTATLLWDGGYND